MKTINVTRKLAVVLAALILASAVLGSLVTQMYFPQIGQIKGAGPEDPLEAWSEASYVIWQYNSTFYACRNMSTLMVEALSSNKTYVQQQTIGNLTISGGTIYLKQITFDTNLTFSSTTLVIQDYQGKLTYYTSTGSFVIDRYVAPYSYLVSVSGSNYFMVNGTTGDLDYQSTNDDTVIQYAIDNTTTAGGSVYIKSGTYTATVVLKTLVRLIIEKNAATITVSINAGATAILEDYNAGRIRYWVSGSLMYDENMTAGSLTLVDGIYSGWANATNLGFSSGLWYGNLNRTDSVVNPIGMASYIIDVSGSTYRMKNGTTGQIDFQHSNATLVEQYANGNLTGSGGMVWLKEIQHNTSLTLGNKVIVIESYNGTLRSWSNQGKGFLPSRLAADPDTSGWGDAEAPYWWYNYVQDTIKYWNGTGVVILPSIGGGSSLSYTLPYSYTIYKTGSTYYSEKSDGTILSNSTLASTVIQATINVDKVAIFFRNAEYNILTSLDITNKTVVLVGEDWDRTVFTDSRTGATNTITASDSLTPAGNLTVRNICFNRTVPGDYTNKYPIRGSWNSVTVEHCRFLGNSTLADYSGGTAAYRHLSCAVSSGESSNQGITNFYFINNYIKDFQYGTWIGRCIFGEVRDNYVENAQTVALGFIPTYVSSVPVYSLNDNTLVDCAWFDEGITVDSGDPVSALHCVTTIANNVIYNQVSKPLMQGIALITTSGYLVEGNQIYDEGASSNTAPILVNGRTSTVPVDIVIRDNYIYTGNHYGIYIRDGVNVSVTDNTIVQHTVKSNGAPIFIRHDRTKAYGAGSIFIKNNIITTVNSRAIRIERTTAVGGATGTIDVILEDNVAEGYTSGFLRTDITGILHPIIGLGNQGLETSALVLDAGIVTSLYYAKSGSTASCVNGTWILVNLVSSPTFAELKVNGTRLINSTCYVIDPTIIAQNNTHVQIEFLCNNAGTIAAVGTAETKTILWSFEYKP